MAESAYFEVEPQRRSVNTAPQGPVTRAYGSATCADVAERHAVCSLASQDDGKLRGDWTMAETLDTLAAKLDALGERIDKQFEQVDRRFEQVDRRFEQVDRRFEQVDSRFEQVNRRFEQVDGRFEQVDRRFDDLKAHLTIKIEAVDAKVNLALEHIDDFLKRDVANAAAHARIETRADGHEIRITALERGDRRKR
jgi:chromosome segregation ATPase